MSTKVYGASDDLVEFEGELSGEIGYFGTEEHDDLGILIAFNDGTILAVKYGKNSEAIWGINVLKQGVLYDRHEPCFDSDARPYSDVVHFKDGALTAWTGSHGYRVR